jgi:hypothetical protein
MQINTEVKDEIFDYGRKTPFASFLPGISGVEGIPMWCYYVNRGQAVVSFGVQDKDHSIMEFYPAHTAYQNVKRTGFRTFIKVDGEIIEPFSKENDSNKMSIYMNVLGLEDVVHEKGIKVNVNYGTLPGEKIGALMRVVEITNESDGDRELEIIDGMPCLIPYGVNQESMKMMAQTTKAWMQVEDVENKHPYYRVRVSMEDSAEVSRVEGGNFAVGFLADGTPLDVIVDPGVVFDYDLSLENPMGFVRKSIDALFEKKQNTSNELPCAFFGTKKLLKKNETITLYELIGQVRNKDILGRFLGQKIDREYFQKKFFEAAELTEKLTAVVNTKTANKVFDNYCRYNYMDNVLRGGTPIRLTDNHTFYVYSRKHGDLERDYNYFAMSPEFYSQGNGNFRDVNQNRRCDTFFSPEVMEDNIKMFYSLIQLDGYNPLSIEQMRYQVSEDSLDGLCLKQPFTPGELAAALMDAGDDKFDKAQKDRFVQIMSAAEKTANARFGEGYWSDHWTYNLDLIEEYLEIYPDKAEDLLYNTSVKSFNANKKVLPRFERYTKTENGIRQYNYLVNRTEVENASSFECYKNGREIDMSLMAKLILMCAVKFATLDAYGLGVEMEGGKPGWYDALNGLPGLMGSSMNETYELARMVEFTKDMLVKFESNIVFPKAVLEFISEVKDVTLKATSEFECWNCKNDIKEQYRAKVYSGLDAENKEINSDDLKQILEVFSNKLKESIQKAVELSDGIAPAYFTYEIDDYECKKNGIIPKHFTMVKVPYFLEGPVRYFKLGNDVEAKRNMYSKIKNSDLYDEKLSMYKVNASLQDTSFEIGRCRAFTPGWLENESIWLHMEYKYLLELIRSGLYEEFFLDFKKAAIPFLDREEYGRSTLENSSFIVSSKNPNESIHGKGFVARLSGSTIEFISMWKLIFFGKDIFKYDEENGLIFALSPAIPEYLISSGDLKHTVSTTLLGKTELVYEMTTHCDYIPGEYVITDIEVELFDGTIYRFNREYVTGEVAKKIRDRLAKKVTVKMTPK